MFFFFSSIRRHTRCYRDWSSDVCSSDLVHGEGRSSGSMPSSSRACTRQAWSGSRDSCSATLYAVSLSTPRRSYIIASSRISARGRAAISRCSTRISAAASSAWLATEVYSPVAIEIAPATRPASPVSTTVVCGTLPPATPAISAKFDTRPSITPKTAGRSQPPVTSRWRWWISIEPAGDSRGGSAVTVRGYVGGLSVRDRAGRLPGLAGPLRGLADHLPGLADHLPGLADHLARFGLDHLVGLADRLAGCGLRRSARSPRGLRRVGRRGRLPGLPRSARRPSGVLRVGRLPAVGRRDITRRRLDVGLPRAAPRDEVRQRAGEDQDRGPDVQPQPEDPVRVVHAQRLDPEAADGVRHRVQRERPPAAEPEPAVRPDDQAGDTDVPERLVQERRVVRLRAGDSALAAGVDPQAPGQRGRLAEQLLVEVVAPAADGLRQHDPRGHRVGERRQRDAGPAAADPGAHPAERDRAPDAEPPLPDLERVDGVPAGAEVQLGVAEHVVQPAADQPEHHRPDRDVHDRAGLPAAGHQRRSPTQTATRMPTMMHSAYARIGI